jgi:hypothetical protein
MERPDPQPAPTVFISYAWEDGTEQEPHCAWVAGLARRIQESGAKVLLDQWNVAPGESLTQFMERSIEVADVVVVICTPAYAAKTRDGSGGVSYEQRIVAAEVLSGRRKLRVIPVLRLGGNDAIPMFLRGRLYVDARDGAKASEIGKLIRAIHEPAAATPEPVVAKTPRPRKRRWPLALVAVLVVAGAVIAFAMRHSPVSRPPPGPAAAIVRGTVFDTASQNGVAGARVSAGGVSTTTDTTGLFQLMLPRGGAYTLRVEHDAYLPRPYERAIEAPIESVEIALMPERRR